MPSLFLVLGCSSSPSTTAGGAGGTDSQTIQEIQKHSGKAKALLEAYFADVEGWEEGRTKSPPKFRSEKELAHLKKIRSLDSAARLAVLNELVKSTQLNSKEFSRVNDVTHAVVGLDKPLRDRAIQSVVLPILTGKAGSGESEGNDPRLVAIHCGLLLNAHLDNPTFAYAATDVLGSFRVTDKEEEALKIFQGQSLYLLTRDIDREKFTTQGHLWADVCVAGYLCDLNAHRLEANLLQDLAKADTAQPVEDYGSLLEWFLCCSTRRRISEEASLREKCAEYLVAEIKKDPKPALAVFANPKTYLTGVGVTLHPEIEALLPDDALTPAALKELEFTKQYAEKSEKAPVRRPYLKLSAYLPKEKRDVLIEEIFAEAREADEKAIAAYGSHFSYLAKALTPQQAADAFLLMEPSPFGNKTEPEIQAYAYAEIAKKLSPAAKVVVGKWLMERFRELDVVPQHYSAALAEVADAMDAESAAEFFKYLLANYQKCARAKAMVLAFGKKVPAEAADLAAKQLLVQLHESPNGTVAATQADLLAVLVNSDPNLRYQGFEKLLQLVDYDPEATFHSSKPRETELQFRVRPAMVTLVELLPAEQQQKVHQRILETLTGDKVNHQATVLCDVLAAAANAVSADQVPQAVETLQRFNRTDVEERIYRSLTNYVAARPEAERSLLAKSIFPDVYTGKIISHTSSSSNSAGLVAGIMRSLPDEEVLPMLDAVLEMIAEHDCRRFLYVKPLVDRVPIDLQPEAGRRIVEQMRKSDSGRAVLAQAVANLKSVDPETQTEAALLTLDTIIGIVKVLPEDDNWVASLECAALKQLFPRLSGDTTPVGQKFVATLAAAVFPEGVPDKVSQEVGFVDPRRRSAVRSIAILLPLLKAKYSEVDLRTLGKCLASLAGSHFTTESGKQVGGLIGHLPKSKRNEMLEYWTTLGVDERFTTDPDFVDAISLEDLKKDSGRNVLFAYYRQQQNLPWRERIADFREVDKIGILSDLSHVFHTSNDFEVRISAAEKEEVLARLAEPDCAGFELSLLRMNVTEQFGPLYISD